VERTILPSQPDGGRGLTLIEDKRGEALEERRRLRPSRLQPVDPLGSL